MKNWKEALYSALVFGLFVLLIAACIQDTFKVFYSKIDEKVPLKEGETREPKFVYVRMFTKGGYWCLCKDGKIVWIGIPPGTPEPPRPWERSDASDSIQPKNVPNINETEREASLIPNSDFTNGDLTLCK